MGGIVVSKLNIAIADDNEWTLQLFEEIVKSDHDLNIVGSARDGEGILSVIEEKEPDVVCNAKDGRTGSYGTGTK